MKYDKLRKYDRLFDFAGCISNFKHCFYLKLRYIRTRKRQKLHKKSGKLEFKEMRRKYWVIT